MKKHIAIVEDEPALRENYSAALARHGYSIKTYANRRTAMQAFQIHLPDLAIIDISLEDEAEGGFDLCRDLRALSAELPIIFLTARDSELDAVSGLRLGADDFLTKDVSLPHAAARQCRRDHTARLPVDRRREDADHLERRAGHPVPHRVLDRARVGPQSGACEEPAAIDGCRERRVGRQYHHLSHQTHAPKIPADRPGF